MKHPRTVLAILALSVAGAGGGAALAATAGGSTTTATASTIAPATKLSPMSPRGAATTVHAATATVAGSRETILVNAKGFPLYYYQPDTTTQSMVSGELASLWPPLTSSAPSLQGARGAIKQVKTSTGDQVTYNGHFLYTFIEDSPGHVTGQGVQDFFVATPGMSAIGAASTAGHSAPAPTPTRGYGY
jgi:predicted lipoprotein with Yx(FWY)xxD motif